MMQGSNQQAGHLHGGWQAAILAVPQTAAATPCAAAQRAVSPGHEASSGCCMLAVGQGAQDGTAGGRCGIITVHRWRRRRWRQRGRSEERRVGKEW